MASEGVSGGIKLAPLLTEMKVDIKNFKSDMEQAKKAGKDAAEEISKELESTSKVGDSLSKVGNILTVGVTTPLLAAGTAVGKFAIDAENSMAMLQGQLGLTAEETEQLQEVAQNVYENGYGDSIESCVADLALLRQNVRESKDWTEDMTQSTLEQIETITALFDTNADEVTRTVQVMKSSGLIENVSEGLDIITYGFQNGANYSGEMLDTLREYSPQFVKLGLDADSAMQLMIQGAENGAFNLDKIGDALKELSIRVVDGSDTTVQGFEAMGLSADEMAQKFAAGGDTAKAAFQETLEGLASIEDPVERNIAGVNLFGTMWEDLGETVILSLADVEGGLEGVEGATERAGEGLNNTFSARATSLAREFKDSLLPLGEVLLDIGEDILPEVKEGVEDFADMMEDMDSETAKNVITFGALAAAAGPVIKTISGGISVYTKLSSVLGGASKALGVFGSSQAAAAAAAGTTSTAVGASGLTGTLTGLLGTCAPVAGGIALVGAGIYAIHEQGELMNSTVLKSREEMSWLEKVFADLSGTTKYTREELEEMGFVYKDFSENISPEFQEAVEKSAEDVQNLSIFMQEIGFDGVITEEESAEFNSRIEQACDEAIATIQAKKEEMNSGLAELFVADDGIIDEGEQQLLDYWDQNYDTSTSRITEIKSEINAIEQQAFEEKRALNDKEIEEIENYYAEVRRIELESLAGNEEEMLYAKNEFTLRAKNMDLESASELLQEKAKIREDEILQIQASYNTQIDMQKAALDDMTGEARANAEKQIADLEADRDRKVQEQQGLYDDYIEIIRENNPKMLDEINKFNGELLTESDKTSQNILADMQDRYANLSYITQSGMYYVYDTVAKENKNIVVNYDEATGEIVGIYDTTSNEVGGYTADMAQAARDMANDSDLAFSFLEGSLDMVVIKARDGSEQVVDSCGRVVGGLEDVTYAADGTRTAIVNVNGVPVRIRVDKDGTITALDTIGDKADYVSRDRYMSVYVNAVMDGFNAGIDAINRARSYNYNGLDNVPYDGYQAVLHKGERVLTAEENRLYSDRSGEGVAKNATIIIEIGGREIRREIVSMVSDDFGKEARRKGYY